MYENDMNNVNEVIIPEVEAANADNGNKNRNGKDFLIGAACGAAIVPAIYGLVRVVRKVITKAAIKKATETAERKVDEIFEGTVVDDDIENNNR